MKLLGTSKTSTDNKITIIKEVSQRLNLKQGDIIAFYEVDRNIIIKKATLRPE